MKKVVTFSLILCLVLSLPASAHVLLHDELRKMGAVLHITPDDDPIAGEPSDLVFDIQDQTVTNETHSFSLSIFSPSGTPQFVPILINRTVVLANYIFPSQGLYRLELRADPIDTSKPSLTFTHNQLIARGVVSANSQPQTSALAEIGLIAGSCGFIVLGILYWNNREVVKKFAKERR